MANIKSQKKRAKTNKKAEARNKALKSEVKHAIKKAKTNPTNDNVNHAVKLVDQAITNGIFHKNKAARLKSKLQKIPISK